MTERLPLADASLYRIHMIYIYIYIYIYINMYIYIYIVRQIYIDMQTHRMRSSSHASCNISDST